MSEAPVNITYNIENYFEQTVKPSKVIDTVEWGKLLKQVAIAIYYALHPNQRKHDYVDKRVWTDGGTECSQEYELWEDFVLEAEAALKSLGYSVKDKR